METTGLLNKGASLLGLKGKTNEFMADEGYRIAAETLADLRSQEAANDRRITELLGSSESKARDTLRDRASRLIEGNDAAPTSDEKLRTDLAEAYDRRSVLREAIAMQREKLSREKERVGREICAKLRGPHAQLVRRLATRLVELGKVAVEEIEFCDRLNEAGVSFTADLRPMPILNLGDPREAYSAIGRWLREAIKFEFVGRDEVPAEWIARWEK